MKAEKYIYIFTKKTNVMKKFSYEGALAIIDCACDTWDRKLNEKWGKDLINGRDIEVEDNFYKSMIDNSDLSQIRIIENALINQPLLTTEDGYEIFPGDVYYYVTKSKESVKTIRDADRVPKNNGTKRFYFKSNAVDYVNSSSVILTTVEGTDIFEGDTYYYVTKSRTRVKTISNAVNNSFNDERTKRFSDVKNARAYVRCHAFNL